MWDNLKPNENHDILKHLSGFPYPDSDDEFGKEVEVREFISVYGDRENYCLKIERFVREHQGHITLRRLMHNKPITSGDIEGFEEILFSDQDIGDKGQFEKTFGKQSLGKFIRTIVGLDRDAAKEVFSEFLTGKNLSADQITFIDQIVEHLVKNGVINPDRLFEQPFTDFYAEGLAEVFRNDAERILALIDDVNRRAEAA
jgi:type I restriction enzyme, R subunit